MLIHRNDFIGLDGWTHLCAGGETPILKSHREAVHRFFADKALGEESRERLDETSRRCKARVGTLLNVGADDIAFLASSSEGINLLAHALSWEAGDNVVVADVEFPSDVLPWTRLRDRGVELRILESKDWFIRLEDIEAAMDERTRVVAVSHVSYLTGQRHPLRELSRLVRSSNALLSVDATHAAGVVPVDARYADILVASCYKWLLGVHGAGIFYWNRERLPNLQPPFLGWHTPETIPDWKEPGRFIPRSDAGRFEPGNESFISVYILDNALDRILRIGIPAIEAHVLHLSGMVRDGLCEAGWEMMTPSEPEHRAGNVCFMAEDIDGVTRALKERGVLIWGGYGGVGRVRVSTHLYNDEEDVNRFLAAIRDLPVSAVS